MFEILFKNAQKDMGLEEVPRGSNRHPRIQAMLRNCGLNGAYPWCAAAVVTWIKETYGKNNPVKMSADCDVLLAQAMKHNLLFSSPEPGDIALRINSRNKLDATHAILVFDTFNDGDFVGFEGNTNNDGSRDGYKCCVLRRNKLHFKFFRWAALPGFDGSIDMEEANTNSVVLPPVETPSARIALPSGDIFAKARIIDDRIVVPVREFYASLMGQTIQSTADTITFDDETKKAEYLSFTLKSTMLINGSAWCQAKELLGYIDKFVVDFDNEDKILRVRNKPN